jgi:hypothetical protein
MKKTCPLLSIAAASLGNHLAPYCLEETCGWWSDDDKACAVVAAAMPMPEEIPVILKQDLLAS